MSIALGFAEVGDACEKTVHAYQDPLTWTKPLTNFDKHNGVAVHCPLHCLGQPSSNPRRKITNLVQSIQSIQSSRLLAASPCTVTHRGAPVMHYIAAAAR